MRKFKSLIAVFLVVTCLFTVGISVSAASYTDSATDPITNWVTSSSDKEMVYSRPMYDELESINNSDIGVSAFTELTDIYSADDKIYILDGGAGRLVVTDSNFKLLQEIKSVKIDGNETSFAGAKGVLTDKDGNIFICDTSNSRVLILNADGSYKNQLTKPVSEIWPDELLYQPVKMAIDDMGYYYILCDGSYYGAVMYNPELEFKGFFGANTVSGNVLDALGKIWDLIFNNNEKRKYSVRNLPYSFVDLVVDPQGYIYTCTGTTTGSSAKGAIRRLNSTGQNILLDKSTTDPVDSGEVIFATEETSKLAYEDIKHDMSAIAVDNDGVIYALDSSYGRVYVYDTECNLLTTIGGGVSSGKQVGTFQKACAVTTLGDNVYVIDSGKNTIAVFSKNAYGKLVHTAQTLTINGDYNDAAPYWQQVVTLDRNSMVAYRGLAKAYLLNNDYNNALKYAKLGFDRGTYSQAFEYVRKDFLTVNFTWIALGAVALVVAAVLFLKYKKKHGIIFIKNEKMQLALGTLTHPSNTFYDIKYRNKGSVLIATALLVLWYIFKIIGFDSGFIFNSTSLSNANAWYALGQTFGLVILFTIANWLVCTLFEGKAKIKQIYIVVCYSLIPMIIQAIGYDILSNVLTLSEASFLTILNAVCMLLTAFYLIMGLIQIQEYSFGKFFLTTLVTVFAMVLIVFLIFMVGILVNQLWDFIRTIFMEAAYR